MKNIVKISFIIVNYNNSNLTIECVKSINKHLEKLYNLEIFVVDNGSKSEERNILKKNDNISNLFIYYSKINLGFGKGNNLVFDKITGDYVVYLNNDTLLIDDSIKYGMLFLEQNADIGMIGANLLHQDFSPNVSYGYFPFIKTIISEIIHIPKFNIYKNISMGMKVGLYLSEPFQIDFPCGAFMLLRKKEYFKLNGFDNRFFMYFEETDMSYRLKHDLNKKIYCYPNIKIIHITGSTSSFNLSLSKKYFYNSWKKFIIKHKNYIYYLVLKILMIFNLLRKNYKNPKQSLAEVSFMLKNF